ncbi:hypothetical protein ACF08N_14545 [Streptomyces sp. NPDC015127]|uniref:hypothetical protein n=1 Tax=Streptomyces sp. NPDC015127 TaxID=3364939 RepID=UPI0036FB94E1
MGSRARPGRIRDKSRSELAQASRAVHAFRRVLTDDGLLFVLARAGASSGEWWTAPGGSRRWFRLYERAELESLLRSAGFAVLHAAETSRPEAGRWISLLAGVA